MAPFLKRQRLILTLAAGGCLLAVGYGLGRPRETPADAPTASPPAPTATASQLAAAGRAFLNSGNAQEAVRFWTLAVESERDPGALARLRAGRAEAFRALNRLPEALEDLEAAGRSGSLSVDEMTDVMSALADVASSTGHAERSGQAMDWLLANAPVQKVYGAFDAFRRAEAAAALAWWRSTWQKPVNDSKRVSFDLLVADAYLRDKEVPEGMTGHLEAILVEVGADERLFALLQAARRLQAMSASRPDPAGEWAVFERDVNERIVAGDLAGARSKIQARLVDSPTDPRLRLRLAQVSFALGRMDECIANLEPNLAQMSGNYLPQAQLLLAEAFARTQRMKEALALATTVRDATTSLSLRVSAEQLLTRIRKTDSK